MIREEEGDGGGQTEETHWLTTHDGSGAEGHHQLYPEETKICVVYKYAKIHYAQTYIVLHAERVLCPLDKCPGDPPASICSFPR